MSSRTLALLAVTAATALVAPSRVLRAPAATARAPLRLRAEGEGGAEALMAEAAALRAEAAAMDAAAAPPPPTEAEAAAAATTAAVENRAKITRALEAATRARDRDRLKIALVAAEEGGFSGKSDAVRAAVVAYNELTEVSDKMRSRLVAEAKSQGAYADANWNPGNAYIGIFALMAVLVVAGGKDIFY